jgi:hypothetical protein
MCYAQAQVLGFSKETPRHNDTCTFLSKIQTTFDNLSLFVTSDVSLMVTKTSMFGPLNP